MNAFCRLVRRNDAAVRIEMHLGAARDAHLRIDGPDFSIETIHIESGSGVCHNCESGLTDGCVHYSPEPLNPPPEALICCATPMTDVALDL